MPKETMRVLGYVRVSTENQLENYSVEEQAARIRAYCAAKGWDLLRIYTDGGFSGGNTKRPALQKMLGDIQKGTASAVVVYKLDRLSRSQKDTLTLIEDCFLANQTDFISINENFDTSTPFGRAMIGMLSVFAQLEKDQITERFTMGRIGRGKAGYYHGGGFAPTGYDYKDGLLVVNEYEAMQVREAFQLFTAGKSLHAIARLLNESYAAHWTPSKVYTALQNSVYIGQVHFRGESYAGVHKPLIDRKLFLAANCLLKSGERESRKTTAQKTPYRAGYLLSSLVYCARCGARYAANHGYYKCYSRAKSNAKYIVDPDCRNDNWKIEDLDRIICEEVDKLISRPGVLDVLRQSESPPQEPDRESIRRRVREIESQSSKLVDLYQAGAIPLENAAARLGSLSREKEKLQSALAKEDGAPATCRLADTAESYRRGFRASGTDERRMFLASLIERVVVDGKSVEMRWRL